MGIALSTRIDNIVSAQNQDRVRFGEIMVDVIHGQGNIVGDVGFGEQDVHVSRHASSDGVNGKADLDTTFAQAIGKFLDGMLSLGDSLCGKTRKKIMEP